MRLEVERVIEEARRRASDEPDASLTSIKRALGVVRGTTDIDPAVKAELDRRLSNLKQFVELSQVAFDQERQERQQAVAAREAQRRIELDLQRDDIRMKELLNQVRHLLFVEAPRGNRDAFPEAEDVAQRAVELRPGDGAATAARFSAEAAGQLDMADYLRNLRADRFLAVLEQVEMSHVPFPDEPPIRYPSAAVWRRLTEGRRKWKSVDLHRNNPVEQRIIETLDDNLAGTGGTDWQFFERPLSEAVKEIGEMHDFMVLLDKEALLEDERDPEEEITLELSGITLRSALKILLEPLGLTYVVENEVMVITTELAASEKMSTRVYPVADLVIPVETPQGGSGGAMGGGGGMGGMGGGMGGMGGGGMGGMGGGMGGMGGGMGGMFMVPPRPRSSAGNATQQPVFNKDAVRQSLKKKLRNRR